MNHARPTSARSGITLIECVLAAAILATVTVAGLRASGAAAVTDSTSAYLATATDLAASMLAEVGARAYSEPSGGASIGVDSGETAGVKSTYDDADDYNGHSESPPQDQAGAGLSAFTGWTRSVTVARASLSNPDATAGAETGLKRITVTVSRGGKVIRTMNRLISNAP